MEGGGGGGYTYMYPGEKNFNFGGQMLKAKLKRTKQTSPHFLAERLGDTKSNWRRGGGGGHVSLGPVHHPRLSRLPARYARIALRVSKTRK